MGLFAAALPGLISAGVSLFGGSRGQDIADRRANELLAASQGPSRIDSPFGTFNRNDSGDISLGLTGNQQQDISNIRNLRGGLFEQLNDPEFVQNEVDRLRGISRPREDAVRASLRSQLFNRGRLGVGVGGGTTGMMFNPELAALEEGLARADLERVGLAQDRQSQIFGQFGSTFGLESGIFNDARSVAGIASALRPSNAGLSGVASAGQRAVDSNDAFFASLAQGIGGLFGGQQTGGGVLGALEGLF